MDVEETIDALYAGLPEEFVAARTEQAARARKAGDAGAAKRIAALPRPTLAAWAANLLAHREPEQTSRFRMLGEALRTAHHTLDAARLRDLSHRQHTVVAALAGTAARLAAEAGHPLTPPVRQQVEQILRTVLADEAAAEVWASGRLSEPPAAAVDFPPVAPDARPPTTRRGDDAEAEAEADAEAGAASDTTKDVTEAKTAARKRTRKKDRPEDEARTARAQAQARAERARAERALAGARRTADRADAALARAREAEAAAQRRTATRRDEADRLRERLAAAEEALSAAEAEAAAASRARESAERTARQAGEDLIRAERQAAGPDADR
ncbi:hypothetical protein [Streptomyces sp. NPDC012888]|uniref:hypothetical protein n=1 Tax=Streptomyces sp. NPDC012888 TaxID=3364855 RepID=UPI0036BEC3A3